MSLRYSAQEKLIKLARMIIETTEFLVVSQYTEKKLTKKCLEKTSKSAFACGLNRSAFQEECLLHRGRSTNFL
jgi:hypothetical protein